MKKQQTPSQNNSSDNQKSAYLIVGVIAFSQGILGLSDLAISYLYKDDFEMSPAQVSIATSLTSLPWIFKPIWGIISDTIPFLGYRRKSYLVLFSFIGFFLWQCMAQFINSMTAGVVTLFFINLSVAFCNVIGEALIVEISQKKANSLNLPEEQAQAEASKNVSLFFGIRSGGTLITAFLSGELLEIIGKHQIFAITSLFPLSLLLVALFLDEKKSVPTKKSKFNKDYDLVNNREAEETDPLNPNSNNENTAKNQEKQEDLFATQWVKFKSFICLPEIYKPILFIFLFMMMPSPGSSMFYFYTNELHFTPEFLGSLRFIYASGSIGAVLIYNKFLKSVSFVRQFVVTTVICLLLGYSQILLVTRDNLRLGIPDKLFTLGDSVIIQIVGEINTMPLLVLACRMCPKDIEGTMYALLMSTLNFGGILSGQLGGVLTYMMGITDTNFDNLWLLLFITNSLQLVPIFLLSLIDMEKIKQVQEKTSNQDKILEQPDDEQSFLEEKQNLQDQSDILQQTDTNLFDTQNISNRNYLSFDNTQYEQQIKNNIQHEQTNTIQE